MKKITVNVIKVNEKPQLSSGLDSHKWASKMLIRNMLSGKPDLKIKQTPPKSKTPRHPC